MKCLHKIYPFITVFVIILLASCSREEATLELPNPTNVPSDDITSFNLEGPDANANVVIDPNGDDIVITWEATESISGGTVTYEWLLDAIGGDFSAPLVTIPSDNSGIDNQLTITQATIDQLLIDNGLNSGDEIETKWTVRATEGSNFRMANSAFPLTLKRTDPFIIRLTNFPDLGGKEIFVAGEFQNAGVASGNWQEPGTNPDLKLQQDTDGSYFIELNIADGIASFQFKFFRVTPGDNDGDGSGWADGEGSFTITGGCSGAGNRTFNVDPNKKEVTFNVERWEQDACPTNLSVFKVTIEAGEVPADKGIFLAGQFGVNFGGDWQQPGTVSTLELRQEDATTYYLAIPIPAGTISYKYFVASTDAPTWDNGAADISCNGTGDLSVTIVPGTTITNDNVPRFSGVGSCE